MEHYSVLLKKAVELLDVRPDGIYVDATLGRGGHAKAILEKLKKGKLIAFDKDETAIEESRSRLSAYDNIVYVHDDFRTLKEHLKEMGIEEIDGIILDLGVSSPQLDDKNRGFSYRYDARLDMRMDRSQEKSAWDVINRYEEKDLRRILKEYGEEPFASAIAKAIVKERESSPIDTTLQLSEIVKSALPKKVLMKHKHPAKQTFQAIRIEVNDELNALSEVLDQGLESLKKDGRMVVISFHSLEDRIVKQRLRKAANPDDLDRNLPVLPEKIPQAEYELLLKKPLEADVEELEENLRSHSAKLRAIRRK